YNTLTDSEEVISEISAMHLQNLAEIFVKYNVQHQLGVHLIHSHAKVAAGKVMLSHRFTDPSGYWNRATPLYEVNLAEVHGHVFKLVDENRFVAYEYVVGRGNDLSNIGAGFLIELAGYIESNGLGETVGLQVRDQDAGNMVEFDFGDCGTVMLNAQESCHDTPFRTTGWIFSCDEGIISFKGVETHAPTTKGPHKVFIDGKLAPDVAALKAILRRYNVIG
ncbi:MAG: hypothetical protein Q9207_008409, partial [Kuettlingeria erythrocarpa]